MCRHTELLDSLHSVWQPDHLNAPAAPHQIVDRIHLISSHYPHQCLAQGTAKV